MRFAVQVDLIMKLWLLETKIAANYVPPICEAGRGLLSIMVVRENGLRNMVKRNSIHDQATVDSTAHG